MSGGTVGVVLKINEFLLIPPEEIIKCKIDSYQILAIMRREGRKVWVHRQISDYEQPKARICADSQSGARDQSCDLALANRGTVTVLLPNETMFPQYSVIGLASDTRQSHRTYDRWTDGRTYRRTDGQMDRQTNGLDRHTEVQTDK